MHWQTMHHIWSLQGPPLRPPSETVEAIVAQTNTSEPGRTLLLGVTPEFHGRFRDLVAVDLSEGMVECVWPGNTDTNRAYIGDWLSQPKDLGPFVNAVGDFSLCLMGDETGLNALLETLYTSLAPGGRLVSRIWTRPETQITEKDLLAYASSPQHSFHAMRLRIGMFAAQESQGVVNVRRIWEIFNALFPDRDAYLSDTRTHPDLLQLIDNYSRSQDRYYYPTVNEILSLARKNGFAPRLVSSGDYPFSSDCPILVAEKI